MPANLYRVIVPVADMERGVTFYQAVLAVENERVSPERHYFHCGSTILALVTTSGEAFRPNPELLYFGVPDIEATYRQAKEAGCGELRDGHIERPSEIVFRPWGERSFYCADPFGNPICLVDEKTLFTGRAREEL